MQRHFVMEAHSV